MNIALIPSYEPDDRLPKLVKELSEKNFIIVVVDDGSGNKYKALFDECSKYAKVISYDINQGKGHALKEGYKYIKDNYNNYVVVTMDSDGQHKVDDAIKLVNYIKDGHDYLLLGKRPRSKKTPLRSRIGNGITKFIFHISTGLNIYDTQTGLRAFSNNLMDYMLSVNGERFEYEMNVLLNLKKRNIKVREVEIETIYIDNNKGSHFNVFRDSFKIYKEIFKFSLSSIICFVIDYLLYVLFVLLSNNIILSNISARVISASINYEINSNIVFKYNNSKKKAILKYALLALTILIFNTVILEGLTIIGINKFIAKILTEVLLFIFSWLIQKRVIFK